jgi:prepilin-type N-terminal cleavage/methylation domain-containing protein/prepilin-type processing-associated H-X9-DG protein
MCRRKRHGFTLVELLVVVVIISMLVGLLIPAVMAAREAARRTQCMNHQKELATAVQSYIAAKDHYPGYVNPYGNSWAVVLFEHLGRRDLWKQWRTGAGPVVELDQLSCPNDQTDTDGANLSYVVNVNLFRDRSDPQPTQEISPSDVLTPQNTVMLSERLEAGPWTATAAAQLAFDWDQTGTVADRLSANHGGMVIITFCDGHAERVRLDTPCSMFSAGPD